MLQVSLSQLKTHSRRFIAITLAVLLAVAFLSATLMVNASAKASLKSSIGEGYASADLVISPPGSDPLTQAAADKVAAASAVADSYALRTLSLEAKLGSSSIGATLRNISGAPSLEPAKLSSGAWPANAQQVTVDQTTADRNNLSVGSKVTFAIPDNSSPEGPLAQKTLDATISGITASSNDPLQSGLAQFAGTLAALRSLNTEQGISVITANLKPGVSVADAKTQLAALLELPAASILTADEQTTAQVASFTGGQDELTVVLLAFAAVALLVAALVVANTFSVLVAQRTRELALLRCVGASRHQIRSSVMLEALIVGFVASVLGVLAATGTMALVLTLLSQNPDFTFATLAVPPSAIVAGLLVGTLLTVVAALVPARAATAVAPLAALRPAEDASVHNSGGRIRLTIGVVLILLGGIGLVVGGLTSQLMLALPAGAASFVGFLLAASLFVPKLVSVAGKLAAPAGVPGKMAAANAVRNPRRTTATASALLIGVTLVTMMMTGAATARTAFESSLDGRYPVDIAAQAYPDGPDQQPITGADLAAVRGVPGVKSVAALKLVGTVKVGDVEMPAYGISDADASVLLQNPANRPSGTTVIMPEGIKGSSGTLQAGTNSTNVAIAAATTENFGALASLDSFAPLTASDPVVQGNPAMVWIAAEPGLKAAELMTMRTEIATALHLQEHQVSGAVLEKAMFGQVIDMLLLVVTGLLAVAVFIALIGVANTLSLSVLERTRENSLLRALGLTRGQLRGMLALEALLIAGVAAIIGSVLGAVYGWAGAQSALGSFTQVTAVIPWGQILAVVGVAAVAGLLASVIPARRAAKLSPVEGLAMD
ncbi:FtsX-like permease family protein [Arthrobacter sp. HLT1-20]